MRLVITFLLIAFAGCLQSIELSYDKVRNNLKGIKSYEKENIEEAVEYFEKNVIENPGDGDLHFNLGNAYYRAGEYNRAANEYSRALRDKNFKHNSLAWHNVGNSFFEQQKYKEALDMYRNAIITDSKNADARYNYELAKMMLQAMENQEEPKSDDSDSEQDESTPSEETDDQESEDAEGTEQKENEEKNEKKESDIDKQSDIEDAEDMLRSLIAKEKELLEEEKERNRRELNLKGKFW